MPEESFDLLLDADEDHPRHLVPLAAGQVLALGGDDGTISVITFGEKPTVKAIRRFDEAAVRALAVSPTGKRVALGFENGQVSEL